MADYSRYKSIKVDRKGPILTITMNRPEMNAVNAQLHSELSQIFADANMDRDAKVVVLTGSGKAFSAGGDIKWMEEMQKPGAFRALMPEGKKIVMDLIDMEKPVIAKLNGHAIGLGATMALLCDIIIASDKAKIGDPHVQVGLVAGDGGAVAWPFLIGMCRAKEFLFTGDLIDAPEAARIGLINKAVPAEKLDEEVDKMATRLAGGALVAINYTKISVNKTLRFIADLIMDTSLSLEGHSVATQDHLEGVRAFIEKRKPQFKGM